MKVLTGRITKEAIPFHYTSHQLSNALVSLEFQYELLCCVQDDQDPAIILVEKLKDRYPKVDCKLFIGKT